MDSFKAPVFVSGVIATSNSVFVNCIQDCGISQSAEYQLTDISLQSIKPTQESPGSGAKEFLTSEIDFWYVPPRKPRKNRF